MEKFREPQIGSEIRVFVIFSRLHHSFSLILHKIAAWDNVYHLVDLKPQKKDWAQIGIKMIFYVVMLLRKNCNVMLFRKKLQLKKIVFLFLSKKKVHPFSNRPKQPFTGAL